MSTAQLLYVNFLELSKVESTIDILFHSFMGLTIVNTESNYSITKGTKEELPKMERIEDNIALCQSTSYHF